MTPVAETAQGKVQGTIVEGVAAFKAIPYGAPTFGANRFLPPQPPASWAGVRDATAYRGQSPQVRVGFPRREELGDFGGSFDPTPETEDCLTLNVWTTATGGKRPVMVWFHGGAFSFGSANNARLQGSRLARRGGGVVVTVNQRLNIFGHLDLSAYGAQYAQSGNAGALDMVAALEWVRENISAFGGDAGNVTIFGESGGGAKVCTLLAMPRAVGLFHKAIVQSGAATRLREPERALRLTEAVLKELGLARATVGRIHDLSIEQLKAVVEPAHKAIGPSQWPLFDRYPLGPSVDGTLIPAHPFDTGAPAIAAAVPVIVGDMKDEASLFTAGDDKVWHRTLTEAELRARIAPIAGDATDRVLALYAGLLPGATPAERLIAALTDGNFRIRSLRLAESRVKAGHGPTWMYNFAWETPVFGGRLKAPHALDVPFCFDTIDLTQATDGSPAAFGLAEAMSGAWAAFAHTGVPHHGGIPPWRTYDLEDRATLILDAPCTIAGDHGREGRELWQAITAGG